MINSETKKKIVSLLLAYTENKSKYGDLENRLAQLENERAMLKAELDALRQAEKDLYVELKKDPDFNMESFKAEVNEMLEKNTQR